MKSIREVLAYVMCLLVAMSSGLAFAAGDSGTGSMGEMNVSGGQFLMILGGLVAMGLVIWVLAKFLMK